MHIEDFTEAKIKEIFAPFLERFNLTIKETKQGMYWDEVDDPMYVPQAGMECLSIVFDDNPMFRAITIMYEARTNGLWGILYNRKIDIVFFEYRPLPKGCDLVSEDYYKIMIQKRMDEYLSMFVLGEK